MIGCTETTGSDGPSGLTAPGGTVLVVDDEEAVRRILRTILTRNGYRVIEASNGHEALDVLDALDGGPDLLISDVVMPGMDGVELACRIGTLRPRTGVLLISGQAGEWIVPRRPSGEPGHFLRKPFTAQTLLHEVRGILGRG